MSRERQQRPAGGPGAEGTVFGKNSKSKFDYNTPCSCHINRPCQTCRGWAENYRSIRATKAALRAITPKPRLGLVRGGRHD
jgi:hypothetical protein